MKVFYVKAFRQHVIRFRTTSTEKNHNVRSNGATYKGFNICFNTYRCATGRQTK